jgi:hypothetical protein
VEIYSTNPLVEKSQIAAVFAGKSNNSKGYCRSSCDVCQPLFSDLWLYRCELSQQNPRCISQTANSSTCAHFRSRITKKQNSKTGVARWDPLKRANPRIEAFTRGLFKNICGHFQVAERGVNSLLSTKIADSFTCGEDPDLWKIATFSAWQNHRLRIHQAENPSHQNANFSTSLVCPDPNCRAGNAPCCSQFSRCEENHTTRTQASRDALSAVPGFVGCLRLEFG